MALDEIDQLTNDVSNLDGRIGSVREDMDEGFAELRYGLRNFEERINELENTLKLIEGKTQELTYVVQKLIDIANL